MIEWTAQKVRQLAIGVVGGALVILGIALLVLPGPGLAIIVMGIGVLAFEFETPRRWQRQLRARWRLWRSRRSERKGAGTREPARR
jgi:hypothetical protein